MPVLVLYMIGWYKQGLLETPTDYLFFDRGLGNEAFRSPPRDRLIPVIGELRLAQRCRGCGVVAGRLR